MAVVQNIGHAIDPTISRVLLLHLGEFLIRFLKLRVRFVKLRAKSIERLGQIVSSGARRARISWIGEVERVANIGALLLIGDFAIEIASHTREFGNHCL